MKLSSNRKEQLIIDAKTIIENAKNDEFIKERILTIGYDDARIEERRNLQKAARIKNVPGKNLFVIMPNHVHGIIIINDTG